MFQRPTAPSLNRGPIVAGFKIPISSGRCSRKLTKRTPPSKVADEPSQAHVAHAQMRVDLGQAAAVVSDLFVAFGGALGNGFACAGY